MQSLTGLVARVAAGRIASGAHPPRQENWVVSWTGSVQGPYPVGNPSAQPDQKFAFPDPAAGARDQTFRLIVRPDLWGRQARIRLSNAFGTKPVTFDGVYAGLQLGSAALFARLQPPGDVWRQDVRHGRRPAARSGATPSRCRSSEQPD